MSNMAVDGLVSGLNTTDLINSLMQLEAAPQRLLKSKSSDASKVVTALQGLNTKVASLAASGTKAAEPTSWDAHTVTSSSKAVTGTASTGAQAATLTFAVDAVAQGQVSMVGGLDVGRATALTITRAGEGGEPVEIFPVASDAEAGLTLDDVARAINAAPDAGVKAVRIQVDTDEDGKPVYGLQLSGAPGTDNAFQLHAGARSAGDTLDEVPATTLRTAQDATITLWPGDVADGATPIRLTSADGTFSDVLPGVSFTTTATTKPEEPVTLTVEADATSRRTLASDLVSNASVVLSDIGSRTARTTSTEDGRSVVSGGVLTGDTTVRFLADNLRSALSMPVDGTSPSTVGITLDRYGAVAFDAAVFDKAMADDPDGTQAIVAAVAQRVADIAERASDPKTGTLSQNITSQESRVSDLGRQVEEWDRRLEVRRLGLTRTYTNLEVTLGKLNSQSSWLAGQLASLPSYGSTR